MSDKRLISWTEKEDGSVLAEVDTVYYLDDDTEDTVPFRFTLIKNSNAAEKENPVFIYTIDKAEKLTK